jgi:peptide/nickel transport system ATP-binding protein
VSRAAVAEVPLLAVEGVSRHYRLPRESLIAPAPVVRALSDVSLTLHAGRSLGVVGESGSGKSTLARLAMALERPDAGRVVFDGRDLSALDATALRRARAGFQMVFQDPYGSLDPRRRVWQTVAEPLAVLQGAPRAEQHERAAEALEAVGLRASDATKYPHEFSGGQRQRIAIARALITRPRLIVADEPVSALDVSVQAQVLNLMQDLQDRFGVTYLFVSHDLAVVDLVCDAVIVLYQGRIVEYGDPDTLFRAAAHPYTRALLEAVPALDVVDAVPPAPSVAALPATTGPGGCPFAPRCGFRQDRCLQSLPPLRAITPVHQAACHEAERVMAQPPIVG